MRQRGHLLNPSFPVCCWACWAALALLQLHRFPEVSLRFIALANAVLCCLSASVHPQRPCSVLFFWISLAASYVSELSFRSFMCFYSVLFILASCYVRMMSCFGLKSFKSSANVIRDKLTFQNRFLLSIRQTGLVFSHVVSISYSGETRSTCVWGRGCWTGV